MGYTYSILYKYISLYILYIKKYLKNILENRLLKIIFKRTKERAQFKLLILKFLVKNLMLQNWGIKLECSYQNKKIICFGLIKNFFEGTKKVIISIFANIKCCSYYKKLQ